MTSNALTRAALAMGRRLCASAEWSGQQCTWIIDIELSPRRAPRLEPCGPMLYRGTAGIALFLAQLYDHTGDEPAKRTAIGAMENALEYNHRRGHVGYYSGISGVLFAALRVGTLTKSEQLHGRATQLFEALSQESAPDQLYDVIGGSAGAIPVLLSARTVPGFQDAVKLATHLGTQLLESAHRLPEGWAWGDRPTARRWLTGFAHGASGIGLSLLELARATGESRFRFAGEQAFAYERAHFSTALRNWPDFRDAEISEAMSDGRLEDVRERVRSGLLPHSKSPHGMMAWCHGAPGVGLARLRAYSLFRDQTIKQDAVLAVEITRDAIQLGQPPNYSLCHGKAGNCETLLLASELLERADLRVVAETCMLAGIERYERSGSSWPSGWTNGGQDPSLMMGEAGIGSVCLRLASSSVPSSLLVMPEHAAADAESTDASWDHGFRVAEIDRHLGATIAAATKVLPGGLTALLGVAFAAKEKAPAIAVWEDMRTRAGLELSQDAQAAMALAGCAEAAKIELLLTELDLISDFLEELAHERTDEVNWTIGRWRLASAVRVLQTGSSSQAEGSSQNGGAHVVIVRRKAEVVTQPVSAFAGIVLEEMRAPIRFSALVDAVSSRVDCGGADVLRNAVLEQVRMAHRSMLVVRSWGPIEVTGDAQPTSAVAAMIG